MFAGLGLGLGLLARTGQRWAPSFTHKIVLPRLPTFFLSSFRSFYATPSIAITLNQATKRKRHKKVQKTKSPKLDVCPQMKGVCTRLFVTKPKKPNSAKRKVARVKLSNGNTVLAYVPGEGHNLQEHSVVLVRGGNTKDLPGVGYVIG